MKKHLFKRILSMLLVAAMLAGYYVPGVQAASTGLTWKESDQEVSFDMSDREVETHTEQTYAPTDMVRVSIVLEEQSTVQAGFPTRNIAQNAQAMAHSRSLQAKQETMAQIISDQALGGQKLDVVWNLTLVGNVISANVPYSKLTAISRVDGVRDVFVERMYEPCVVERDENAVEPQMYTSLGMVGSYPVWSGGYTGAGSRIAIIDTGVDTDHQSLDSDAFLYSLQQNAAAKGISYEEYVESLDLLDMEEIAAILPDLNINEKIDYAIPGYMHVSEKLAFAANYVDGNLNVDHEDDYQGEHGSHVTGIAAANRYIPQDGGFVDALSTVKMAGMAPDAQVITMKVFGESSPYESDYMSAVEDAILLGCDAVNLSLGSSVAGEGFSEYYGDLVEYMTKTDTVVVASAGNAFSWPKAALFGYLYSDDVNMDTVGSPGSYTNFFTVASVNNDGGVGAAFQAAGRSMFYGEALGYGNLPLAILDTTVDNSGTEYDYVFIDGIGYPEDYEGIDLTGKVVFCARGYLNFVDKANAAAELGAAAVIIYNNTDTGLFGMDLTGIYYETPCVSISQEDALEIRAASATQQTADGLIYYTGKMTILGQNSGVINNSEYYTMSDFSSWGTPGNLTLKPEITAPGGNIYSLWGTNAVTGGGIDQYELMSGTSMAAPAITGMVALLSQYLEERGLAEQEGLRVRTLAQSLLMSTAVPLMEEDSGGHYYSLLKQGAGLGRVDLAAAADSYILVDGQSDGKVKAELGDDPNRTGVYEFSFSINNLSGEAEAYTLSADIFCQDQFEYLSGSEVFLLDTWTTDLPAVATFTVDGVPLVSQAGLDGYDLNGDGKTDAEDADYLLEYLVGNQTRLYGEGDVSADGMVTSYDAHVLLAMLSSGGALVNVPAGGSVTVDVKLTLTAGGKAMLDEGYANGTYVEAFVYAESVADEEGVAGTVHSIPVLAFYGNWSDATMFDHGTYVEVMAGYSEKAPYLYSEIGCGNTLSIDYGDGGEYYFGGNPYLEDYYYLPQRSAFNSEGASRLVAQYFTLIRLATEMKLEVVNADTGEVYYSKRITGTSYPAYYRPGYDIWENVQQVVSLGWRGTDASGAPVPEDTQVEVILTAVPEYYRDAAGNHDYAALGDGAYMITGFTIDNTAPEALTMNLVDSTLTVTAKDNQYVAAVMLMDASGTAVFAAETPDQTVAKQQISVELDLTGVTGKTFLLVVCDYAGNERTYEIQLDLPEVERPYLTVVDANTNAYYGLNLDGSYLKLAEGFRGVIHAAEFVDGYVFEVCDGDQLYVGRNDDLYDFTYLGDLDPNRIYGITTFLDLAYNAADGKLYGLFYCSANYEATSMLCTIDMFSGEMEVLAEMPVDVHTMAIDDAGNFYSTEYGSTGLYTYTVNDLLTSDSMSYVGSITNYGTGKACTLAWDHDADTLYYGYPGILLEVNPANAALTVKHYNDFQMRGMYIVPATYGNRFAATDTVSHVSLSHSETRTLVGSSVDLNAKVSPWNVTDDSVTWSSANPSVATVDQNGVVTGVSVGTTTITATSNLDPTKRASCTMTVIALEKTLNGLLWDEYGGIWMVEFDVTDLSNYTKLSSTDLGMNLASATVGQDGIIYAASLDTNSMKSNLYKLDPETFAPTLIGASTDGYVDLAPAPGQPGKSLMAAYGGYVLNVDADSGDYYNWYNLFEYNLVGIAYAGSQAYAEYGYDTVIDWYFIIDWVGNVFLMGFLEQDGSYYYMESNLAPGGVYTQVDFEMETPFFGSAYFDGEFLYYSAYQQSSDNVTLMAIDVAGGSKACYTLGTFADGIWPVGGLMELDATSLPDFLSAGANSQPKAVDPAVERNDLTVTTGKSKVSFGGLNAVSGQVIVPDSAVEFEKDAQQVVLTLTPSTGISDATNGRMTVTYNADELKLVSVNGTTPAFAYAEKTGTVEIAFADAVEMDGDAAVALLTFEVLKPGEHTVSVLHTEDGDGPFGKEELLTVSSGCVHVFSHAITDPTCTEKGYTIHFCTLCDYSYVDSYVDELGHNMDTWAVTDPPSCTEPGTKSRPCTRCDYTETEEVTALGHDYGEWYVHREATWKGSGEERRDCSRCLHYETRELKLVNPFTDVSENRYYYKPIMWAYYSGITSGKTATTFEPDSTCTRAQVMTFLWAAAGRPEPTSLENPFTDVSPSRYYYKAVLWAVENGITSGTSATTFSPDASCTRNQVVTFLWVYCGRPEPTIDNPFTDVEAGKYYYKPILWAYENGITTGKTATTFEPHSPCTRGQIMTFLFQALAEK